MAYDTPSMWKTRHEKRHVAVCRDMDKLETRLMGVESALASVHSKLDAFLQQGGLAKHEGQEANYKTLSATDDTVHVLAQDLEVRLDRMELLLFRASVNDFEMLDKKLWNELPHTVALEKDVRNEKENFIALPFVPAFPHQPDGGESELGQKNDEGVEHDEKQDEDQAEGEKPDETSNDEQKTNDDLELDQKQDEDQAEGAKPDEKDNKQEEVQGTDTGEEIPVWVEMLMKTMDKVNNGLEKT